MSTETSGMGSSAPLSQTQIVTNIVTREEQFKLEQALKKGANFLGRNVTQEPENQETQKIFNTSSSQIQVDKKIVSEHESRELLLGNMNTGLQSSIARDKDFFLLNPEAFQYASQELKKDRDLVFKVVCRYPKAFEFADEGLKNDKKFVLGVLIAAGHETFQFADDKLKEDKDFVMEIVEINYKAFQFAAEKLRGDRLFVFGLSLSDPRVNDYAAPEIQNERDFIELEPDSQVNSQ